MSNMLQSDVLAVLMWISLFDQSLTGEIFLSCLNPLYMNQQCLRFIYKTIGKLKLNIMSCRSKFEQLSR